ncbi:MAG: hypothetical protein LIO97_00965, partial [Tannerellaceae bacterium]|nr:hypothetical protein [Tannerellaceae bacterium]
NKQQTYIAITLGPITRIIQSAQSTKELWAASYFFSYLAKKLIEYIQIKITQEDREEFLFPAVTGEMFKVTGGVGVFPDRYIFPSEEGDFEYLRNHVDNVLKYMAGNISEVLYTGAKKSNSANKVVKPADDYSLETIYTYLTQTLRIYFFEKAYPKETPKAEVVADCEYYLNVMENQDFFPSSENINYLQRFLKM